MAIATLLNNTDFDRPPYDVPLIPMSVSGFNKFCEEQQEVELRRILGNVLYDELSEVGVPVPDAADQHWKDLVNGANYSTDGINTYRWVGLAALLKPYIYYNWLMQKAESLNSVNGASKGKGENADSVSSLRKIHKANVNYRILWGIEVRIYSCARYCEEDSFYGFMKSHATEFPDWLFKAPKKINPLGI